MKRRREPSSFDEAIGFLLFFGGPVAVALAGIVAHVCQKGFQ